MTHISTTLYWWWKSYIHNATLTTETACSTFILSKSNEKSQISIFCTWNLFFSSPSHQGTCQEYFLSCPTNIYNDTICITPFYFPLYWNSSFNILAFLANCNLIFKMDSSYSFFVTVKTMVYKYAINRQHQ